MGEARVASILFFSEKYTVRKETEFLQCFFVFWKKINCEKRNQQQKAIACWCVPLSYMRENSDFIFFWRCRLYFETLSLNWAMIPSLSPHWLMWAWVMLLDLKNLNVVMSFRSRIVTTSFNLEGCILMKPRYGVMLLVSDSIPNKSLASEIEEELGWLVLFAEVDSCFLLARSARTISPISLILPDPEDEFILCFFVLRLRYGSDAGGAFNNTPGVPDFYQWQNTN